MKIFGVYIINKSSISIKGRNVWFVLFAFFKHLMTLNSCSELSLVKNSFKRAKTVVIVVRQKIKIKIKLYYFMLVKKNASKIISKIFSGALKQLIRPQKN